MYLNDIERRLISKGDKKKKAFYSKKIENLQTGKL